MKNVNSISRHLGAVSALALTAAATVASIQPAGAAQGVYGGGSSLFSIAFRQLADCYHGRTPTGAYSKPASCALAGNPNTNVEALYASVGSGAGRRAFVSNDSRQLIGGGSSPFSTPPALPQYLDTFGFLPFVYPYPTIDFGASDDPLPVPPLSVTPLTGFSPASGWQTIAPGTASITAVNGAAVAYNEAKLGKAIQIPAAEVGVAVVVNAPKPSAAPWQIAYQGNNVIHLSQPQICAIFSAAVTDWSDSTTSIAWRDSSNALQSELFSDGNQPGGSSYTSSSLPIKVVYRGDGSGTSFILTNFLNNVCPFFDDGANQYQKIFAPTAADITAGYVAMPTNTFSRLITNINKAFPSRAATTATWSAQTGNGGVAAGVSNNTADPGFSGRLGYVSNDFAQPYSKLANAPLPAAVQDEAQRLAGVYHASGATPFITPNPTSIALAWKPIPYPKTVNYTDWDVYKTSHTVYGGLTKSMLAVPTKAGAYSLSGTAYMFLYSCYADATGARVTAIADFMSWLIGGSLPSDLPAGKPSNSTRNAPTYDINVSGLLKLNGFNALPRLWALKIMDFYVKSTAGGGSHPYSLAAYNTAGAQVDGCRRVTGGGAQ